MFLIILQANDPFHKVPRPAHLARQTESLMGFHGLEKTCRRSSTSSRCSSLPLNDGAIKCFIGCQRRCCSRRGSQLSCSSSTKSCHAKHKEMKRKLTSFSSPFSYSIFFCFSEKQNLVQIFILTSIPHIFTAVVRLSQKLRDVNFKASAFNPNL